MVGDCLGKLCILGGFRLLLMLGYFRAGGDDRGRLCEPDRVAAGGGVPRRRASRSSDASGGPAAASHRRCADALCAPAAARRTDALHAQGARRARAGERLSALRCWDLIHTLAAGSVLKSTALGKCGMPLKVTLYDDLRLLVCCFLEISCSVAQRAAPELPGRHWARRAAAEVVVPMLILLAAAALLLAVQALPLLALPHLVHLGPITRLSQARAPPNWHHV